MYSSRINNKILLGGMQGDACEFIGRRRRMNVAPALSRHCGLYNLTAFTLLLAAVKFSCSHRNMNPFESDHVEIREQRWVKKRGPGVV